MSTSSTPAPPREAPTASRAVAVAVPLAVAAACVVALVELAQWVLSSRAGQRLDQSSMEAVYGGSQAQRRVLDLLGNVSMGSAALVLAVCVVLALLRRRYAAALAAVVLVGGANLTTQALKRLLVREDFGNLTIVSLPSGHTTVAISLVLAALLVVPRGLRLLTCLGGTLLAVVTGAGTVVAQWHRPADVVAAALVALAWGALVAAVLAWGRPARLRWGGLPEMLASVLGAVAAGIVLVVAGVRPTGGWSGVGDAALTLTVMGAAVVIAVALYARLSEPHSD
ncbi:phosphatase PAP2 family protein [Nocardioides sp.]|uniref:phosphatase PAP2 family protein n=1 Tax=Nocardioides sp. TaxID=35761 RepID=UPI002732B659|nr:phosphatase PAP2 family protein [Nocardioides sp.]MDP3890160.1 phosphatase PAP2 family protein [Nocardioides sp.]